MGQLFNREGSNLATIARETGYPVVEVGDWKNHYHDELANHVYGVVTHHTAGLEPDETDKNFPSLRAVRYGTNGLPGPLSQYGMGYDGTIYVVSAGLCYHAGDGEWRGISGNEFFIGIEAEDSGDGDWTFQQLDCYPRLCARICQFLDVGAEWVCGHKEYAPGRKIDPAGINMKDFRAEVDHYLKNPDEIYSDTGGTMALNNDDIQKIARATRAELLNRDIIDRPGKHPDNPRFKVRHALEGIWRQATASNREAAAAHEVAIQNQNSIASLARAVEAMASNLDPVVRDAVHEALEDVSVTISYSAGSDDATGDDGTQS